MFSLQLPRHKSVVVSLNNSDDSDSDVDACSSTQTAFGGLEFMIKEARRSVEVRLTCCCRNHNVYTHRKLRVEVLRWGAGLED